MARPLRLEYPGAVYHITSRGNAKQAIFGDDVDRETFLHILGSTVKQFHWMLYAYCLMGNHYHLLVETPVPSLSRGMRRLNGLYTQRFNRRHGRMGHVLQGRFGAILVERETYLLELVRYIALNPVRAAFTATPEAWRWSSHRAHAGLQPAPPWLCGGPVLALLGEHSGEASERYRRFVAAGIGLAAPWSALRGQVILGTDSFAERLRAALAGRPISREVPRLERFAARPALETLLPAGLAERARRNAAILEAHTAHGYTLSEIARHVGLHYSTVSRIAQARMPQSKT
jgi:putative transposase